MSNCLPLEKCTEILCKFGLTPNQSRVYLAAARMGLAPVSEVSKTSNVRREDTYRALLPLEELGLVEKIPGKPTKIRALPAEEAFSILFRKWKETTDERERELTRKKAEFLTQFNVYRESRETAREDHLALFLEKNAVVDNVQMMVKNAQKEIDTVTSADELVKYFPSSFVSSLLETLNKKKVKVRIILELPKSADSLLESLKKQFGSRPDLVSLKSTRNRMSHYVIVDYKQLLLATSPQPSLGELPYLWTDVPNFAELLQKHFEDLWHSGTSLKLASPKNE